MKTLYEEFSYKNKPKMMIIKLQLSVITSRFKRQMLAYNEDRSLRYEADATDAIIKIMGKENKKFFYAELDENKKFIIHGEAPWQEW